MIPADQASLELTDVIKLGFAGMTNPLKIIQIRVTNITGKNTDPNHWISLLSLQANR
ncbi:Uncharacterised protein [Chlamydia abortus]|nr:Uncharacterised protein [Chlamydia abortus]